MAVESRFVVIRHGVEVQTFMDKKSADEYDKMLDMADNLTAMLDATPFDLSEEVKEDLSIYLAQNREDVLVALQAKKAKPTPKAKIKEPSIKEEPEVVSQEIPAEDAVIEDSDATSEKAAPKKIRKKAKSKTASDIAKTPDQENISATN